MAHSEDSFEFKNIKTHYRSGSSNLATDFFIPCLMQAKIYRRSAGFFSSSALLSWIGALPRIVLEKSLIIELIASPILSSQDIKTLRSLSERKERQNFRQLLVEDVLTDIENYMTSPDDMGLQSRIFAWLLANDRLKIKFAFPTHTKNPGMFHEKIGIFQFNESHALAFTGSANESMGGHTKNYESIDVFRDWISSERHRVDIKKEQFLETWNNSATGLSVLEPTREILDRIISKSTSKIPKLVGSFSSTSKWRHQEEAIQLMLNRKAGVLEMATGTGKTRTTLKLLQQLVKENKINSVIIATDGTDLLDQWYHELLEVEIGSISPWLIYRQYAKNHEAGDYVTDTESSILLISHGQLKKISPRLTDSDKKKIAIIHDEVHGLGAPSLVASLEGFHKGFVWKVGLSATPERIYDEVGTKFIENAIGPRVFQFPLERAIERGILCEFDYVPLSYELTQIDRDRIKKIYSKKAARAKAGRPMSKEEVWTEISRVYKTAVKKIEVFASFLEENSHFLKRSIIFVETKEFGEEVLKLIHPKTHLYRTYYAEDERSHLVDFANNKIDCLITCHRISQGIDIQSLNNIILFSAARAQLETIQRIGRCLRSDPTKPEKVATVIDFVREQDENVQTINSDQERMNWLSDLSKTRKLDNVS